MKIFSLLGFDSASHSVRTEVTSGVTAFLTVCYILAVVPSVLATTGIDRAGAFTATALVTGLTTLLGAFWARQPFIQGPGLGLNAFFAFTIVQAMGYSYQEALAIVFVESAVFLVLILANVHRHIIESIPSSLRHALVAGIGMFISFIGLKNAGIIVSNPSTLVQLGEFTPAALLGMLSILLSGILTVRKVSGAMFYSIAACTLIGLPLGVTTVPDGFLPFSLPHFVMPVHFHFNFMSTRFVEVVIVIFTLLIINVFDALGSAIGVSSNTGAMSPDGSIPRIKGALAACSIGSLVGSIFGLSAVSVMAESTSGAAAGGRTGMSSAVTGLLFLVALFLSPFFLLIPLAATSGCLVLVGVYMISSIPSINLEDISEALPAFITIIMIVLTYSIADGICFGMMSFVIIKLFAGKRSELSLSMYILSFLFLLKEML
ncbi:NCS2 family permease [Prevotella sp. PCHR]|uniref:NCS2 family permease n=1 Tax=Xylanibacter caecicola TaxID=2736294 RepID=A0ABX2AZX8_9BACT|nr:NCS2 family permease [Xylanibacter caecicola]NPE24824.1 NCS2 family permease [Xylanibacter caecicola]